MGIVGEALPNIISVILLDDSIHEASYGISYSVKVGDKVRPESRFHCIAHFFTKTFVVLGVPFFEGVLGSTFDLRIVTFKVPVDHLAKLSLVLESVF